MDNGSSKHYRFRAPSMYAIRATIRKDGQQLGWQVTFVRNRQCYDKHFANSSYGGKALAQPSDPGDGTVPELSAKGINGTVEMVAAHNPGYDHQGAYLTDVLQRLTTYGIARLVAQYMP